MGTKLTGMYILILINLYPIPILNSIILLSSYDNGTQIDLLVLIIDIFPIQSDGGVISIVTPLVENTVAALPKIDLHHHQLLKLQA